MLTRPRALQEAAAVIIQRAARAKNLYRCVYKKEEFNAEDRLLLFIRSAKRALSYTQKSSVRPAHQPCLPGRRVLSIVTLRSDPRPLTSDPEPPILYHNP